MGVPGIYVLMKYMTSMTNVHLKIVFFTAVRIALYSIGMSRQFLSDTPIYGRPRECQNKKTQPIQGTKRERKTLKTDIYKQSIAEKMVSHFPNPGNHSTKTYI